MSNTGTRRVERQAKLPTSKAVEIAWKSIRMRLSRSLVVTSGIILAMAFLMYILSSDRAIDGMRAWTTTFTDSTQWREALDRSNDLQPKVRALSERFTQAAVDLPGDAPAGFDEKKTLGKDFAEIQKDLGALPVSPDTLRKILTAKPDMLDPFKQWASQTEQLRDAKAMLNGPQNLIAQMKSNGVPTGADEIRNAKIQTNWLITLALLVAFAGILNAMLMSVTERFREIGTMKCLGALDSFIVKLFLIESCFQGGAGTVLGILLGLLLSIIGVTTQYGGYAWKMYPYTAVGIAAAICLVVGIILTVAGAVYPAWRAARMAPIEAMRVET